MALRLLGIVFVCLLTACHSQKQVQSTEQTDIVTGSHITKVAADSTYTAVIDVATLDADSIVITYPDGYTAKVYKPRHKKETRTETANMSTVTETREDTVTVVKHTATETNTDIGVLFSTRQLIAVGLISFIVVIWLLICFKREG